MNLFEKIAPYLPYGLKIVNPAGSIETIRYMNDHGVSAHYSSGQWGFGTFKPMLIPISEMIKGHNNLIYQLNCMRGVAVPFYNYDEYFDEGNCIGCKWGGVHSFYFERQTTSFYDNSNAGISPQWLLFLEMAKNHIDFMDLIGSGDAVNKLNYNF